jgi:periplasmic protein CpxP/Spy
MRRGVMALMATALAATTALAQPPSGPPGGPPRPGGPGGRAVMQRLAQAVQRRLGLTDDQATRLRTTTARFATQRQQLMAQERETRRALRRLSEGADSVDQQGIARNLDELLRIQERRIQIVGEEQRELARFLTPLQRAQYLALQERAFRAAQQQRQQRQRPAGDRGVLP